MRVAKQAVLILSDKPLGGGGPGENENARHEAGHSF